MEVTKMIRVLLADDHAVVRAGIRQFLEFSEEIQVVAEAGSGAEALALIEQHQPDVAVLDIQMPEGSGIEVTRQVRARQPQVGVLILTAYEDDPYVIAVLKAGANGYVLKTASPGEIIQAVKDVYAGKSALDPTIMTRMLEHMLGTKTAQGEIVEELSERELQVLTLVGRGYTNKAIGVQLGISDRTVQGHLARIFNKLQASSRTEAVMRAVSLGWLPADLGAQAE
jgi:two-component system, NarL family, response regulator LiaR